MEAMNINYPYITEFLEHTLPHSEGLLRELEQYAEARYIPIVRKETAALLALLVSLKRPARILEVGTAIGYSALLMYDAAGGAAKVVTIERDAQMALLAQENIRRAGADIYVAHGDAEEELARMADPYDFIFLDAAKGQYPALFAQCGRLLAPGGVAVLDNVLFKGRVASEEIALKKSRTIETRMREFLYGVCRDPRYRASIVPVGDGVAIVQRIKGV